MTAPDPRVGSPGPLPYGGVRCRCLVAGYEPPDRTRSAPQTPGLLTSTALFPSQTGAVYFAKRSPDTANDRPPAFYKRLWTCSAVRRRRPADRAGQPSRPEPPTGRRRGRPGLDPASVDPACGPRGASRLPVRADI